MKSPIIRRFLAVTFLLFIGISCSKDADVLRDYSTSIPETAEDNQDEVPNDSTTVEVTNDSTTVDVPEIEDNEPPIAIISTNMQSGTAPLSIEFSGNNSQDDKGVVAYEWEFGTSSATDAIASFEFTNPGIYTISLTVYDIEGLKSTATKSITVNEQQTNKIACEVGGSKANEMGSKIWCWADVEVPIYSGNTGVGFSQGELFIDSECDEKQVSSFGDELQFNINPLAIPSGSWCSREFNMRAELRTAPWDVRHELGTEEWFGWNYRFDDAYIIDQKNQWKFFQVHPGIMGISPQIGLEIIHDSQFNGHQAGEVYVTNATTAENYSPTGIIPVAGQTLSIVVHVIWGDDSNGLLQVWLNNELVYDKAVSTVHSSYPWGGNAKWGIYKWPWANGAAVQESLQQDITALKTYMGTLRMITRRTGDAAYLKDSFAEVAPN